MVHGAATRSDDTGERGLRCSNEGPPLQQVHSDRFIFLLHRFVSVWEASGNTPGAVDLVRGCRRVLNHGQDVWRKLRNGHDQGDSDTAWGDRLQGSTLATLRPQHRGRMNG